MILETSLEIKFECLVPASKIVEGVGGRFEFPEKVKYKRRDFEFRSLVAFLNIPRLSMEWLEDPKISENQKKIRINARRYARLDFYKRWGFLTANTQLQRLSESAAEFDAYHTELWKLNAQRIQGNLENTNGFRLKIPKFSKWTVHNYSTEKLAIPIQEPVNLWSAIYGAWFFGSKKLSNMRTCGRFENFGPRAGCEVFFIPKPSHKKFCSEVCKKASHDKFRSKNKRK